jgi:hypothetical protein
MIYSYSSENLILVVSLHFVNFKFLKKMDDNNTIPAANPADESAQPVDGTMPATDAVSTEEAKPEEVAAEPTTEESAQA